MITESGSKSEGEHLTLLGLICAILGASRSDWSDELDGAMLLISAGIVLVRPSLSSRTSCSSLAAERVSRGIIVTEFQMRYVPSLSSSSET
jgi:hypothetical protein